MTSNRGGKRSSPPPEALAAYKDLAVIGKGSFGRILKVERIADGQIFARKELDYSIMSERDKSQILAEIKILSWLNHINIVKYVERIPDNNAQLLHIIMEYCEGGDLGSLIKKNRRERTTIAENVVWSKLAQMVSALDACHHGMPCNPKAGTGNTPPILHRDLKPENVFLDGEQNVKLGDFGLSKELDAAHALASTYVGTPYYMSPELATGARYDAKSDIWALGCITYELCALRPPFDATSQAELTIKIKSGHVPSLPRGYSRDLENLVRRMLDLDPRKRPSTKKLLQEPKISLDLQSIELSGMRQGLLAREQACEANTLKLHAWEQNLEERERALEEREQQIEAHILVQVEQRFAAFVASSPYAAEAPTASSSRLDAPQPVSRASPIRPVARPSIGARRVSNISDVSMGEASRRSIKPPMGSSARRFSVGPARRVKQEEEANDEWYDTAGGESSSDGGAEEGRRASRSAPFTSAATSLRASRSTARRSAPQQAQPTSTASSSAESSSTRPAPAAPAHSAPAVPLSSSYSSSPSRRATEQQQSRGLTTRKSMPSIPQSITGASSARRTSITPRRVAPPPPMQAGVARLAHLMNQEKAALGGGGAANTSMSAFTERSDVSMRDATFGLAAAIAGGDKENDVGGTSALSAILQHRKAVEEKKKTAGRTSIVAHARRLTLEQQRRQEVEEQQHAEAEIDGQNGAEEEEDEVRGAPSSKIGSRAQARKVEPAMEQRGCDSWDEDFQGATSTPQTQHEDATTGEVAVYDLSNDPDLPSPFLRKDERPSRGTAAAGAGVLRPKTSRLSLAARGVGAAKPPGRSLEQELVRKRQATTTSASNGATTNIGQAAKARVSTSDVAASTSTARLSSVAARRPSHNGGDGPPTTMSRLAAGSAAASRTLSSTSATGSARRQPMSTAGGASSTARIPAVRKSLAPTT